MRYIVYDADRKAFLWFFGIEIIKDSPKPLQEHFIARFEAMEEWEQSQMLATMQRMVSMMDAEDLDASPVLEVGLLQKQNPEK